MKKIICLLILFSPFFIGSRPTLFYPKFPGLLIDTTICSDTITGDFDGDGKQEYIWFEKIIPDSDIEICTIKCSDKKFPPLLLRDVYGGRLVKEGDLNDDGKDEFSVVCQGDASEWLGILVYSFRNGKWTSEVESIAVYCNMPFEDRVKKDPEKKGYVIITTDSWSGDKVISESRAVKMK